MRHLVEIDLPLLLVASKQNVTNFICPLLIYQIQLMY